ncbi:MAG TPA: hypothetical protein VET46_08200 [Steroidobacteraceae bacterium]|nr:hypothetical protein [Steroidobacteraceae bacterium]
MRGSSKARLDMRLARDIPALQRWRWWLAAALVAEAGWFLLVRPPGSTSFHSLFMLGLLPLMVVGYVYLLVAVTSALAERDWDYFFKQMIVVILGSSVGFFVFALMWFTETHLAAELS